MLRGGVVDPGEGMQRRVGHTGSRGEQQVVAGGHEAGVGRGRKEEGLRDGVHILVVEQDRLPSRVLGLGLCMVKRVGWKVGGCIHLG